MTLPPLTTVAALEVAIGVPVASLADADLARASQDIENASALVRAEAGRPFVSPDGLTADAPDGIVVVALRAAVRAYRNPDGLVTENLGGAYASTLAPDETGVYLLPQEIRTIAAELALLDGSVARKTMGVGSIATPSAYGRRGPSPTLWAPVDRPGMSPGDPIPWEVLPE